MKPAYVLRSTLARRVLERNKVVYGGMKHLGRYVTTFFKDFEAELVQYVKDMESRHFGVTCTELRQIAYQLAKRNNLAHLFNQKKTDGREEVAEKLLVKKFIDFTSSA